MGLPRLYQSHVYRLLALFKQLEDAGEGNQAISRAKEELETAKGRPQRFDIDTARILFVHSTDALVDELASLDFDAAYVTFEVLEYISHQHNLYSASVEFYRQQLKEICEPKSAEPESPLEKEMRMRHERGMDGSGFKKLFILFILPFLLNCATGPDYGKEMDDLKFRFASGEITREQYVHRLNEIGVELNARIQASEARQQGYNNLLYMRSPAVDPQPAQERIVCPKKHSNGGWVRVNQPGECQ